MKAKYQFQCLATGVRHTVTFQDKDNSSIEDQVNKYRSSGLEVVDCSYSF
ncbi:hypothetical protein [Paenibacillus lautus]|nr:hypothetical protein [Paenibacillus lautus]MBX4152340.1 hypothetical protein [Paenibacillus lautus]